MEHELNAYRAYRWIILDPNLLGGKPAIRGIPEILRAASEALDTPNVAA